MAMDQMKSAVAFLVIFAASAAAADVPIPEVHRSRVEAAGGRLWIVNGAQLPLRGSGEQ